MAAAGTRVNMHEAKTHLSRLAARAAGGEEIVIARNGEPIAKLVAADPRRTRELGLWKGRVRIAADFDAPLSWDVQEHFEGQAD